MKKILTQAIIATTLVAIALPAQSGSFSSSPSSSSRASSPSPSPAPSRSPSPSPTPSRAPSPTPTPTPRPTPTPTPASVPAKSGFQSSPRESSKSLDAGPTASAFSREAAKATAAKEWTTQQKAAAAVATGVAAGVILHQQQKAADEKAAKVTESVRPTKATDEKSAKTTESVRSTNPTTASTDRQIREAQADAAKARREARWSQEQLDRANDRADSSYWRGRNDAFYWGGMWHPQPQPQTQVVVVNGGNGESYTAPIMRQQRPSVSSQGESESGITLGVFLWFLFWIAVAGVLGFLAWKWWIRRQEQQETVANYVPKHSIKGGNQ